ncbi:MAG: peroxiredoxin [Myxococcales bacterium]|nr:peroxiredoxin [Myxococcota bacterium]MDW8280376.1 peroxiredoxin [Myxococcales bacterium]
MRTLVCLLLCLLPGCLAHAEPPRVGQVAPDIQLFDANDRPFSLASRRGQWTVLYFYPRDDTPGCTRQACAFRDRIEAIRKLGAEVYGVSQDSTESHRRFMAKHRLNFPLLSDPGGKVARAYGADGPLGFSRRWTFLIGPDLKIRWVQTNVDPALNAQEVAEVLQRLQETR